MIRLSFLPFLAIATASFATDQPYGWTISASSTNPFVNTVAPTSTLETFYLWQVCCDVPDYPDGSPRVQGFSAAEFAVISTGIQHLSTSSSACFIGDPPFPPDLAFFCPGCPCGPIVVAALLVLNFPGSMCFAPSVLGGILGTVDCEAEPTLWGMDWIGIDSSGAGAPCGSGILCDKPPVSIDGTSWGRTKSLYR